MRESIVLMSSKIFYKKFYICVKIYFKKIWNISCK